MLSALLSASPQWLNPGASPAADPVAVARAVQSSRRRSSIHARASDANREAASLAERDALLSSAADAPPPSIKQRRASLGLALEEAGLASDALDLAHKHAPSTTDESNEIPPASLSPSAAHSRSSSLNLRRRSLSLSAEEADLPYTLRPDDGVEAEDDEGGTVAKQIGAQQGGSEIPASAAASSAAVEASNVPPPVLPSSAKELSKVVLAGFPPQHRALCWLRVLLHPVQVRSLDGRADRDQTKGYWGRIEQTFRMTPGALTAHLPRSDEDDHEEESEFVDDAERARRFQEVLPRDFPEPPLFGRKEAFDYSLSGADAEAVLAQKRVLAALSASYGSALAYAPALPALVGMVWSTMASSSNSAEVNCAATTEARTFNFCSALLRRSIEVDEKFLFLSPVSLVVTSAAFDAGVKKALPDLHDHLSAVGFDLREWFRGQVESLFRSAHAPPPEALARFGDVVVHQGLAVASVRFALLLLARVEAYVLCARTAEDVRAKLHQLFPSLSVPALFAANTGAWTSPTSGCGWFDSAGVSAKSLAEAGWAELKKGAAGIEVPREAVEAILAPRVFHFPITSESDCALTKSILYALYSPGMVLPPLDPHRLFASNEDGHDHAGMVRSVLQRQGGGGGASMLVVQLRPSTSSTTARSTKSNKSPRHRTLVLFFSHFPTPASAGAEGESDPETLRAAQTAGEGFLAFFDADSAASAVVVRKFKFPSVTPTAEREASSSVVADKDPQALASENELPVLLVEGGPNSARASSGSAPPPSTKRRGSLAMLMSAFNLDRGADLDGNSERVRQVLERMPRNSPFRPSSAGRVRVTEVEEGRSAPAVVAEHGSTSTKASGSFALASPSISAPTSPTSSAGSAIRAALGRPHSFSVSSSTSGTALPSVTRRASLVAGLGRAWSFVSSVPAPATNAQTGTPSNAGSRRSSIGGAGSGTGAASSAVSSRASSPTATPATNLSRRASVNGAGAGVFFPSTAAASAPGSQSSTPTSRLRSLVHKVAATQSQASTPPSKFRSLVNKMRTTPNSSALPPRPVQLATASVTAAQLQSDSTKTIATAAASSPLERRLSSQRARGAEWDSTAAAAGAAATESKEEVEAELTRTPLAPALLIRASSDSALTDREVPVTPGSAAHHYRRLLSTAPDVSELNAVAPLQLQVDASSPSPRASASPIALSTRSFASTSAQFRAQQPFRLTLDDTDGDSMDHAQTVRTALHREKTRANLAAPDASSDVASVLMSRDTLILSAPAIQLTFSLSSTLEECLCQCEGINVGDAEGKAEVSRVEAWSFQ